MFIELSYPSSYPLNDLVLMPKLSQTAFSILQSGVIDRENKSELKKLREAMERIEGEPSGIIDI